MKKKYILFDLDGTLLNSYPGIKACLNETVKHYGIGEMDEETLRLFIGPPLRKRFQQAYGFSEEQAEEASLLYRNIYEEKGLYNSSLYPYVEEILKHLKAKGFVIALASSKNESNCVELLGHFQVAQYFDVIGGATADGRISEKEDVIEMVMERLGAVDRNKAVLIGDTSFDVLGAKATGLDCIGVSYGFGERQELEEAGAFPIFDTLEEVEACLIEVMHG